MHMRAAWSLIECCIGLHHDHRRDRGVNVDVRVDSVVDRGLSEEVGVGLVDAFMRPVTSTVRGGTTGDVARVRLQRCGPGVWGNGPRFRPCGWTHG